MGCTAKTSARIRRIVRSEYAPDYPSDVKFDIEYMADMTALEFSDHLAGIEVPQFDGGVVARANESSTGRIK